MLVDSHAHLNFKAFDDDLEEVVGRCRNREMKVVNVGSQFITSLKAIKIAKDYDGFFAAVGIHPIHLGEHSQDQLEEAQQQETASAGEEFAKIRELVKEKKVIAVGETGLDYFRLAGDKEKTKELQREYFIKHLELAKENKLPVILHCRGSEDSPRDAYKEVLEIIKGREPRGVLHCFGADWETASEFVARGILVGFTGIVTFKKKAEELQEVARRVPLKNILIETDSPYLAPEPHRGERNEPVYVEDVARKIAELRELDLEEVISVTAKNAQELFNI
ncbi:MAG: TatD family hydrolase [Patescibacteria group bacterium]